MNQLTIGQYIARKRKEKNLTQEQLAEKLFVTNKTISKWENGKCMPDYSVIESLCKELGITVAELMDGEDADESSIRTYDQTQMLDLLRRTKELENQKSIMFGVLLIAMGIAMLAVSRTLDGSALREFMSGLLLGLSVCEMLAGIIYTGKSFLIK